MMGGGARPGQQQATPNRAQNRGGPGAAPNACIDIASLSPYNGKRWKIKGRIITKSDVRKFNGARGPGQLFKIEITDGSGAEIAATFFGTGVDQYFDQLKTHQVYYFSGGSIKQGNPKWDRSPCVITFDQGTCIEEAEDDVAIPGLSYSFQSLAQIQQGEKDSIVDLKGVLSEVRPCVQITMRDGKIRPKRSLIIWDNSGPEGSSHIEFTVWGERAEKEDFPQESPIFIKGARVGEFNNMKSLNNVGSTVVSFEAPPAAGPAATQELLQAWSAMGQPAPPPAMRGGGGGKRASIQEVQDENMRLGPAPIPGQPLDPSSAPSVHRHVLLGTITTVFTERPPYYPACNQQVDDGKGKTRACNKKLSDEGNCWRCVSGHQCEQPNYRYLLRARLADHTGTVEVSNFDEAGQKMFGCPANDLAALWDDETRNEELQKILKRPYWQRMVFSVKSQREVWQDEERVKVSAADVADEDVIKEARRKLTEIRASLCSDGDALPSSPNLGGA